MVDTSHSLSPDGHSFTTDNEQIISQSLPVFSSVIYPLQTI